MCGFHTALIRGLSPRVRRHPRSVGHLRLACRSISACAEASCRLPTTSACAGVYLRVCGGIGPGASRRHIYSGLSPRVRRHLPTERHGPSAQRSISACAEASSTLPSPGAWIRVYLRVCGGISRQLTPRPIALGLSPRVRRHLRAWRARRSRSGSISACAEASRKPLLVDLVS